MVSTSFDVAIVGAGPYGLSLAAHLQAAGVSFRIFGPPMETWREHMPAGMLLKSDGFASSLSDPKSQFTLRHFCESNGTAYDDTRVPVALKTFIDYGLEFQQRFVANLDPRRVARIDRQTDGFVMKLTDGQEMTAQRVVLAVGISHFAYIPPSLAAFPTGFISNS